MRTFIAVIVTFFVTVLLLVVVGAVVKKKTLGADSATVVRLEKPRSGELIEYINAPGEIEPRTRVDISAKISARIVELPYDESDLVRKGDPTAQPPIPASVLVRLDSTDLEAALKSVEARRAAGAAEIEVTKVSISRQAATLEKTQILLEQTKRDLLRQKELLATGDVSQSIFDDAKSQTEQLEVQLTADEYSLQEAKLSMVVLEHHLEAAEAAVDQARENLAYTTITAPTDGIITKLNAEVGEIVMTGTMNNPGTVIMTVADLSEMLVVAKVEQEQIDLIKLGQNAKVRIRGREEKILDGTVETIALTPSNDPEVGKCFEAEIALNTEGQRVFSGLTVDVDIEVNKHTDVLIVPSQAILGREVDQLPVDIRDDNPNVDNDKTYAVVVYRLIDGKTIVTPVTIGPSDLTDTIIASGVSEEDDIIIGPYKVLEGLKHDQPAKDEAEESEQDDKDKQTTKDPCDDNQN